MNGLNNAGIFPYSLNNLQVLSLPDGASLPVSCDVPLIRTLTSTNQEISLFESDPDLIDFDIYDKSLKVNTIFAGSGSFNNIYSTGANFLTLNATGINCNTITATTSILSNGSMNAPNANITCFGINSVGGLIQTTNGFTGPFITASSGTFQNVNTNTLTANTININTVNIPNLSFNIATGGFLSTTGTISTQQNFRTTNGINTFDFTDISSSGDTSIYNAGGALQTSFRFDGNERMKLSSSGNLDVSFLQSSGTISTTSGRIQNLNSAWTTNLNDYFINANNDTIFLRPKGETATPADAQAFLTNAGNFTISTGTLSAFNGTFSGGLSATNANISAFALTASSFVNSPYFTGTKADFTNATITNLTGANIRGNFNGNVSVGNPDKMYFYQLDKTTEAMRIEPGAITPVLSWYNATFGSQLQFFMRAEASGGAFTCNQLTATDYVYSTDALHDEFYTTRRDGIQTNSMIFYNNTSFQSRPFIFQNLNQSAYIQAWGNNNRNNGFAIRDTTAERWFIYNKADTSTLAINNNSSDLITLTASVATITPQVNITNTLQVGQSNFGPNCLINLGFSGALGPTPNFRQGYIFMNGSSMFLNNQQFDNVPLLQNSTKGFIVLQPANGTFSTTIRPNGQVVSTNRTDSDAGFTISNSTTGAGYGLYLNKQNDGVNGNNFYNLVIQGNGFNSAITMHAQVSGIMANITLGRTNFPFSNDAITVRPNSLASQDTFMLIANHYQESNGKVYIGQNGTGSTRPSDAFIQNHSNNAGGKKSGIYFQTDTATYGVSCPAQYIDFTGQTFFNPFTNRSTDTPTNSQTGSTLSVVYGFKSLPQVGTVYTMSRGAGKYIPWVKADANNASYTVAGGLQKIALTDATSINASPWQTPAGARQYSFRTDFEGLYDIKWNLNIFASATTAYFVYVYKNGVAQSTSIGDVSRAGTFSFCNGSTLVQCNAGDDIDMRIQADTQTITVGNNSTIQALYHG